MQQMGMGLRLVGLDGNAKLGIDEVAEEEGRANPTCLPPPLHRSLLVPLLLKRPFFFILSEPSFIHEALRGRIPPVGEMKKSKV